MGVPETDPLAQLRLPPGFRFYPTDEELLVQYLLKQVAGHRFSLQIIGEVDLYKHDPWVLPSKAIFGEKEWYFFSPRDRKYPNGSRPNRVAGSGYWKATGTDKIITTEGRKVGIKKALVFYIGKAPKGTKTNWIMHEYRLLDSSRRNGSSKLDDWVLCRVYKKNSSSAQRYLTSTDVSTPSMEHSNNASLSSSSSSHIDDVLDSLPDTDAQLFKFPMHETEQKVNINRLESGNFDWFTLAGLSSLPELGPTAGHTQSHQGMANYQNYNASDVYIPSMPESDMTRRYLNLMEEEEVKDKTSTRVLNAGPNQQNSAMFPHFFSNSVDRYGHPVLNQLGSVQFRFQQ